MYDRELSIILTDKQHPQMLFQRHCATFSSCNQFYSEIYSNDMTVRLTFAVSPTWVDTRQTSQHGQPALVQ